MSSPRSPLPSEDLPFQERSWQLQRAGWIGLAAFIAVAAAGGLGPGPWSQQRVATAAGAGIEYPRIVRRGAPASLRVVLPAAGGGAVELSLSPAYARAVRVESVVPEPVAERVDAERGRVFVVDTAGGGPVEIELRFVPRRIGRITGAVGVGDGPPLPLGQLSLP